MVFSSVIFLFYFLPLVLTLYLLPARRWRNIFFLLASFVFYSWSQGGYVLVLMLCIVSNYLFGIWIGRLEGAQPGVGGRRMDYKKAALVCGLVFNLLLLIVFKYTNFFAENINLFLDRLNLPPVQISRIYVPLGISFFTFHAISYLMDVYRGQAGALKDPGSLAIYLSAFPKVLAGPISQYRHTAGQFHDRPLTAHGMASGIERFITGLAKKVLLANPLGAVADAAFGLPPETLAPYSAWAGILCYTLQIYFDFSGYSDMAIGLGRMFGFEFPENFNFPYISQSVREFWRRWHISLSLWFRNYLYIPLGGNRGSNARTGFNLVVVFLLCGLWHGASWTFIIWGAWYGLFLLLERTWFGTLVERAPRALRHIYLLTVVIFGWVFFRADSAGYAFTYLKCMLGLHWGNLHTGNFAVNLNAETVTLFVVAVFFCFPISSVLKKQHARMMSGSAHHESKLGKGLYLSYALFLSLVFFSSILSLAGGTHKAFIYFRF